MKTIEGLDKRCRVTAVELDGQLRDRLSWKTLEGDPDGTERIDGHIYTQGILMVNDLEPGS